MGENPAGMERLCTILMATVFLHTETLQSLRGVKPCAPRNFTNNETMAASMSRTKKGTVALLKLYILYALMVGLFLVTAVMFHSCVVGAVTAGDVVNSQLARLGAMIIVYSMWIVFFSSLIL
jgi:hypothetical protein